MFEKIKLLFGKKREIIDSGQARKLITDSIMCPYCAGKNVAKRGWREKKLEKVQLMFCNDCQKTFTPQMTKGKHYPLATIFDAVSLYNLGYSLEESCRRVNLATKNPAVAGLVNQQNLLVGWTDNLAKRIARGIDFVKSENLGVDPRGVEPRRLGLSVQPSKPAGPTPELVSHTDLQPSTLSNWLTEFKDMMPYVRLRGFAIQKYQPKDMVITATLAHRQLYRFRFHRAKCQIIMQENFHHAAFAPLKEFLEMVPGECPHQYYQEGLRASETPLTFSKTAMIVRSKQNFATKTANFVLQSVKERTQRHDAIQKFMLYNDSVTVATEVPVYLTRDDMEHMKTQLGFELFGEMPKLITGHIDIVQIRNGQIHLLDYKPNAEKERPIEQLTLYAMALSRLTGLRLFEFKCAWFDEKDYFEFYPLHVLHKPKRAIRRRKVETKEGTYAVNKNEKKIERIRPNE